MPKFKDPNPPWPVPCRKVADVNGVQQIVTKYAHNEKELDTFTKSEEEGGLGYTTGPCPLVHWPKTMSHPGDGKPNVLVHSEADQAKREKEGYTFDHFENAQSKKVSADVAAAPASFDPKAQARIDDLEKKLKEQSEKFDKLLEKLGA